MDDRRLDDLSKDMMGGMESRRAAFRLLAGGLLSGLAARLGLAAVADAKNKQRRTERNTRNGLQDEGRRKRQKHQKGKDKDKNKKPEPQPAECASDGDCASCERCRAGECTMGIVALCDPNACLEPVCNTTTNSWECHYKPTGVCPSGR